MLDELGPLLKNLPPQTASALAQAITRCGKELGIETDWVQRWVGFTIVADALASYAPDGKSLFELKGGAAIEMRMRQLERADAQRTTAGQTTIRPRATRDLDATYHGALDDIETAVRTALEVPRHNFALRMELETPDARHMRRFRIHVSYQEERFGRIVERPFANVKLEVSAYEGTPLAPEMVRAFSLRPFGIEGPALLPCIPIIKQVAQKLHAVTETPAEERINDRFRDLLDIVMLSTLAPPSAALRSVCEETFDVRQQQRWPPEIIVHPHWVEPMEQRAMEMGLDQHSATDIAAYVVEYVRRIASVE